MVFAVFLLISLAIYEPAWRGQPVWDDDGHLTRAELASSAGLTRIWTEVGATQQYYPAVHSVFWLENRLWGHSTLGYHLVSIVLHTASAFLIVVILTKLAVPGAWLAALLFLVHPVHVESVAWISEQKNMLSTFFCLAAALAYVRFDASRRVHDYGLSLALFMVAVLSKSVTATLPALLLILFWWQRGRLDIRRDVLPLLPFGAVGAAFGALTVWVERNLIGAQGASFEFTTIERIEIAGRAVWFYLAKLLWPSPLVFNYPRWDIRSAGAMQVAYPLLVMALLAVLWRIRSATRAPLAAMLMFVVALSPALGFFNVYPFTYSFVADHFQYLASIPILALAAAGLLRWSTSVPMDWSASLSGERSTPVMAAIVALVFSVPLAAETWRHCRDFADAETLYRSILVGNPASTLAHNNLGFLLMKTGRRADARSHLEAAVHLEPDVAEHQANMGLLLLTENDLDGAAPFLERAVELNPRYAEAQANLGMLRLRQGAAAEGVSHLREGIRLKPALGSASAHYQLGAGLYAVGRPDEAMVEYRESIRLNPDFAPAYNDLGAMLMRAGRVDEGVAALRRAVELNANDADARFNFGNGLFGMRRFAEAVQQYTAAAALKPGDPAIHTNLGSALGALGRFDEAAAEWKLALRVDPGYAPARERLALLRAAAR